VDARRNELTTKGADMFAKVQVSSPVGRVIAVAKGSSLAALVFEDHWPAELARLQRRFGDIEFPRSVPGGFPAKLAASLRAYVEGDISALDALPVDVDGTPFQMRVWKALRTIPAGETISYRELATRAGAPAAVRAAGSANGKNPVSLAIPCHRVIHADGSIGGYGGGIERKRWLLEHERRHAGAP
jgi:methylated-DNA-[protein]-cysteine S-methyltransferase